MPRIATVTGLALVSLLALSGCVGLPTSSTVEVGPLISSQGDPEITALPSGPTAGADQEEILSGFMLAMRGPQGGYAVARQFLATSIAEDWKPDASAVVRQGGPVIQPGPVENSLSYTVTSRAYVDADGRYFETVPAPQTFDFGFVQENGEWRISAAPNVIVLSQTGFTQGFTERALYFFDSSYAFLVPDVRWFPRRPTIPLRTATALIMGPAPWLAPGVLSAFPVGTTVEAVVVRGGIATVDLSQTAQSASPQDRDRMRQQLAASLEVSTVLLTVGGLELVTPASGVGAARNPAVEPATLLGNGTQLGFETGDAITEIPGLSVKLVEAGATEITLATDKESAAVRVPGGVAVGRVGDSPVQIVDSRPGLVAPALDPFRFVWSVQADSAATLMAFEYNGQEHALQTGLLPDSRVVSIAVSRDGTRLLLYLATPSGPQLIVKSIIREQGNVPTGLGEGGELAVPAGTPLDATWVDDRRVAALSNRDGTSAVTLIEIGGKSQELGEVDGGTSIVGGNRRDGLRVLGPEGEVWRQQGGNWVGTGTVASFLGTKQ